MEFADIPLNFAFFEVIDYNLPKLPQCTFKLVTAALPLSCNVQSVYYSAGVVILR